MHRIAIGLAMSLVCLAFLAVANDKLPVPPGGDPAMACGQNPDGRAYWAEYAFCDLPVRGPGKALGLIFWSHGVSGDMPAYHEHAPLLIRRLALLGWDVVKVNRNNLYEHCVTAFGSVSNCWSAGGQRHVDDLIERTRAAQAAGYQRVIAAGGSFGGAISLEASARAPGLFHAVVALSPGHGSDAGNPGGTSKAAYYTLDKQLLDVVAGQKSVRLVIVSPPKDIYVPHRDSIGFGATLRKALVATGQPFVEFDETLPISGHAAGYTRQFDAWFGHCVQDFLDPQHLPAPGETKCAKSDNVAAVLLPADVKIPVPGQTGAARWLGAWDGGWPGYAGEFRIVIEKVEGTTASMYYCIGTGPRPDLSVGCNLYPKARLANDRIVLDRDKLGTVEFALSPDGQKIAATYKSGGSTFATTLARAGAAAAPPVMLETEADAKARAEQAAAEKKAADDAEKERVRIEEDKKKADEAKKKAEKETRMAAAAPPTPPAAAFSRTYTGAFNYRPRLGRVTLGIARVVLRVTNGHGEASLEFSGNETTASAYGSFTIDISPAGEVTGSGEITSNGSPDRLTIHGHADDNRIQLELGGLSAPTSVTLSKISGVPTVPAINGDFAGGFNYRPPQGSVGNYGIARVSMRVANGHGEASLEFTGGSAVGMGSANGSLTIEISAAGDVTGSGQITVNEGANKLTVRGHADNEHIQLELLGLSIPTSVTLSRI